MPFWCVPVQFCENANRALLWMGVDGGRGWDDETHKLKAAGAVLVSGDCVPLSLIILVGTW